MKSDQLILSSVREALGLDPTTDEFNPEIIMHINTAIGRLNQNGVGANVIVTSDSRTTWGDFVSEMDAKDYLKQVPLFVTLSTKIIFDPPPPSTVQVYDNSISEMLWRLREGASMK